MPFIPHTDADRATMLAAIGAESIEELFAAVPVSARFPELHLPEGLSELDVRRELEVLAA